MTPHEAVALLLLVLAATGCRSNVLQGNMTREPELARLNAVEMTVRSDAFARSALIPWRYGADGGNVSPPLTWAGAPAETKEFVLIVEDLDASTPKPFVHWIAFRIPPGAAALPEGAGSNALAGQGTHSGGSTGYYGPKPPPGKTHRYFFRLFALDAELGLADGATVDDVMSAMNGKVIGRGRLLGTFKGSN